jgi:phosphoribosylanthranilate isomerase
MITQIYALTRGDDVRALADIGVDHFGFAIDVPPAGISPEKARSLFELVPEEYKCSALTTETEVEPIVEMAEATEPDILHICSDTHAVSVAEIEEVRERLSFDPEVEKSINVTGSEAIDAAKEFDDVSDYLLLDSNSEDIAGIGATGETHDWSVSREIVNEVATPVILAGGLSPENVADAIREVGPQGVDSFTQTSESAEVKDVPKVEAFVEEARRAAEASDY